MNEIQSPHFLVHLLSSFTESSLSDPRLIKAEGQLSLQTIHERHRGHPAGGTGPRAAKETT